jgi:hypothetical protein
MSRHAPSVVCFAAVFLGQAACSEPSAAPPVSAVTRPLSQTSRVPPVQAPATTELPPRRIVSPPTSTALEPPAPFAPEYVPRGRRDPFEPVHSLGAEATEPGARRRSIIASARLTGIVRGPAGFLALVETPDGIGYVLRPGDGIEGGRLIQINRDSVLFDITSKSGPVGEHIVLRLGQAQ